MRFIFFKVGGGIGVTYMLLGAFLKPTLRWATGWENYELQDVNDRNIEEFIKQQEGKKVIELKEGANYF